MYKKSLIQILIFSVALALIHVGLNLSLNKLSTMDILLVHFVLFLLTFGGNSLLLVTLKFDINKVGFAFLAISTIKLLFSASLILIMVKAFGKDKSIGIHYAAVYFLYVLFLSYRTLSLLNRKK